MQKSIRLSVGIILLSMTVAWYSVVNTAQAAAPDKAATAAACSVVAAICAWQPTVCSGMLPAQCGARTLPLESSSAVETHATFYLTLAAFLSGLALLFDFFAPRQKKPLAAVFPGIAAKARFVGTAPPILIGGLAALRF